MNLLIAGELVMGCLPGSSIIQPSFISHSASFIKEKERVCFFGLFVGGASAITHLFIDLPNQTKEEIK